MTEQPKSSTSLPSPPGGPAYPERYNVVEDRGRPELIAHPPDDKNAAGRGDFELIPDEVKTDRRHRGTHSTQCKNPFPFWFPFAGGKALPGELGRIMKTFVGTDKVTGEPVLKRHASRHPWLVFRRDEIGRQRDFYPTVMWLFNFIVLVMLQHVDLTTWYVTLSPGKIADLLSPKDENGNVIKATCVTASRISYILDLFELLGLIVRVGLEWDRDHDMWMPRYFRVTEDFFTVCGAFMDKLYQERTKRLNAIRDGVMEPGTEGSVRVARRKWLEEKQKADRERRKQKREEEKARRHLKHKPAEERSHGMAILLVKHIPPNELARMNAADAARLVWRKLGHLGLGSRYRPAPPYRDP